jgi:O-antigen ligase
MGLILFLLKGRSMRKEVMLAVAVVVVALVSFLAVRGDLKFQLVERDTNAEFSSFSARRWQWNEAIGVIEDHPFFGVGLFKSLDAVNEDSTDPSGRLYPVDNSYLAAVVEQGIIGASLYAAALFLIFWQAIRLYRRGPPGVKALALAAILSLAGISLDAILFDAFVIWPHFILFWIVAGFARALETD